MKRMLALSLAAILASSAVCAGERSIKIGVLGDESGPYSDLGGPGSVLAAHMAAEDFGGKVLGKPIEIISADMQKQAGRCSFHRASVV